MNTLRPRSNGNSTLLWFFVAVLLLFALVSRLPAGPVPYSPLTPLGPRHGILANLAACVVDFFVGGRPFRSTTVSADEYAVRAGQLENLDAPSETVSHNRGW